EDLQELVSRPGPFSTLIATRTEPIAKAIEATVSEAHHLVKNSAVAAAADDAAAVIRAVLPHAAGVIVILEGDQIALTELLDDPPEATELYSGALPRLAPIVRRRMSQIPSIVAIVDRV